MALISVIIPTYGNPVYLRESILSVLNQSFQDFELIIVDDNNPDTQDRIETELLVSRFVKEDNRVQYLKHDKNMNGAVARNTGFAAATGKYISLLDSDDEYYLTRLQRCYDEMENADSSVAGVYTGCEFRCLGKTYNQYTQVKSGNFLVETLACTFMFCTGSNIFVRKSVIDELNGFDGDFLRHQDYEFLVRLFEKYTLKAVPELLVIKNNENFNLPNLEKQISIKKQYLDKYQYILAKLPKQSVAYIMHGNFINIAENAMRQGNYNIANLYYKKAQEFGGLSFREWFRRFAYPIYYLIHT